MMLLTMASLVRTTAAEASPRLVAHDALTWWLGQALVSMLAQATKYIPAGKRCCNQSGACTAALIHRRRARARGSADKRAHHGASCAPARLVTCTMCVRKPEDGAQPDLHRRPTAIHNTEIDSQRGKAHHM